MNKPCPFCPTEGERIPGSRRRKLTFPHIASATSLWGAETAGGTYVCFEPLNPVTPGHLLVAPTVHVESATAAPEAAAGAMEVAATIAKRYKAVNLITSVGAAATQTVHHLHVHIVPRRHGDGLHLPWTGQQT